LSWLHLINAGEMTLKAHKVGEQVNWRWALAVDEHEMLDVWYS
jgi:hypothetical protein